MVRIRPRLIAQAQRYLNDADAAEDTVQDVMLKLWTIRNDLKVPADNLAMTVTRNMCISSLRCKKLQYGTADGDTADTSPEADTQEHIRRMMDIVDSLPTMQQLILRMRHIQGIDIHEIADIMHTNEANVRKNLSRARQSVRDKFRKGGTP
ncbi:RNA polymerase sigma factor [Xylanibacter muris]|uniref:Sigma-70 family RNA polymerase sigma factor n=1 Tax=Xylanibacter muris TaxID=2736290 RepID=A0ABX2ALD6_9BACT|nr:sigma-70 family RNA polymerase sigma factor [Xylanibacter muris]NPD92013.1 sigma-70 family RNA polymerase sigma factor [Xylanibacter muris]